MFGVIGSLMTEGLFYSLIVLQTYFLSVWLSSGFRWLPAAAVCLTLVLVSQLRSAALLTLALPLLVGLMCLVARHPVPTSSKKFWLPTSIFIAALVLVPACLGKHLAQLGTRGDSLAFSLLPRVALLVPPDDVAAALPAWAELASSWRGASKSLSPDAVTQFDAQLQEATRFELGPNYLLAAFTPKKAGGAFDWYERADADMAKELAMRWIINDATNYLQISAWHLWGLLTGSNYLTSTNRVAVWKALTAVDQRTWQVAKLRTDYPNNRIFEHLSSVTEIVYMTIRFVAAFALVFGFLCSFIVLLNTRRGFRNHPSLIAGSLGMWWCLLHSLPAALLLFPEFRFVYANLTMWCASLAVAFSFFNSDTPALKPS